MSIHSLPSELSGFLAVPDIIDIPGLVLTFDETGEILFAGLNRAHEARTGMKSAEIFELTVPGKPLPRSGCANAAPAVSQRQTGRASG